MSDKLKNLIVRTLSGAVMLAVLLGATLYSFWSFALLALLIVVGGLWEFYRLSELDGAKPVKWLGMLTGVLIWATAVGLAEPNERLDMLIHALLFLPVMPMLMLVVELFSGRNELFRNVGATLLGVLYVALPVALLFAIPHMTTVSWEPWVLLWFIFIIWGNDVFAYLVGITLGRHKMCPSISPKKSWEGFVGGLLGAQLVGYIATQAMDAFGYFWYGLALVAAVAGVLGDLVESQFKRKVGVKDSGNLIPGHGGVLDRFDALLMATPFVVLYIYLYLRPLML